jgi:imidazolonepropionase-like amidohydrolase
VQIRLLNEGEVIGVTNQMAKDMGYERELEATVNSMKAMLKRGIRVLPGGDYGFAWAPHGENAKDLEYFVKYLGMTPLEVITSCTKWGGEMMVTGGRGRMLAERDMDTAAGIGVEDDGPPDRHRIRANELGEIRDGYLADLLLVDGDPLSNIAILQDKNRFLAIMKDGVFHKEPDVGVARGRFSRSVA